MTRVDGESLSKEGASALEEEKISASVLNKAILKRTLLSKLNIFQFCFFEETLSMSIRKSDSSIAIFTVSYRTSG